MKELEIYIEELNDYLKEIILCGLEALNEKDEKRFKELEYGADNLGLIWLGEVLEKMRNGIYNKEDFIVYISELREYIRIIQFKMV